MTAKFIETAEISLLGDRKNNQDRCAILSDQGTTLLIIADGLGGHPKGEMAAQILVNICQQLYSRMVKPIRSPEQLMKACLIQAHRAIIEYGNRQKPAIAPRTTAVLAILQEGMAYWSHVGDSRLYLIRDGRIVVQTRDHSVAEMGASAKSELAAHINPNAITRCLGGDPAQPTPSFSVPTPLQAGDHVLLCSDGFWGALDTDTIISGLNAPGSLNMNISKLATAATKKAAPGSDNTTAVVAHLPGEASVETKEQLLPFDQELDTAVSNLMNLVHNHKK